MNDSSVQPITVNRLQKQFGGSSENAYILIYRRRDLGKNKYKIQLQDYLQGYVNNLNQEFEKYRAEYKQAEQHIEVFYTDRDNVDYDNLTWKEQYDIE